MNASCCCGRYRLVQAQSPPYRSPVHASRWFCYNFGGISTNGLLVPQASPLISIINTVNTAYLTNTTSLVSAPGGAQADQTSGGLWSRAIGGTVDTKSDSTSTADFTNTTGHFAPSIFLATGSLQCHQENKQDYAGFQFGADLGKLNLTGTGVNWHFGITGGNFYARAEEQKLQPAPGSLAFPTGDLRGSFEVPFVGFYNVITAGNFFADAQFRWDFVNSTASSAEQHFSAAKGQAQSLSFTTAAAYRIPLPSNWFVEPSFGGVLSHSTLRISDITVCLVVQAFASARASLRGSSRGSPSLQRRFCTSLPGA